MTHAIVFDGSASLLSQIAVFALRAFVLASIAGAGLAVFRVKSACVRLFCWTAVLYVALAMPLLGWIVPPLLAPVPGLVHDRVSKIAVKRDSGPPPASDAAQPAGVQAASRADIKPGNRGSQETVQLPASSVASRADSRPALGTSRWTSIRWGRVATWIYLAVAIVLLARFGLGIALGCRLVEAGQGIDEERVRLSLSFRARAFGLSSVPPVAESRFISVPVTMGGLRPTILLPSGWREWDTAKLDVVIAHEVSHVARRDGLTQRFAVLHRAIFWFSPLSWWLNRHLVDLAEQASDEAVLSCGADRKDYAQTLLGFFEVLHAVPGRVWWQGVSMAKAGQAEKRLERILGWEGAVTMGVKKSLAVVIVTLVVPLVYLVASVRPVAQDQPPAAAAPLGRRSASAAVPVAPPLPLAPVAGVVGQPPAPAAVPDALPLPAAPVAGVSIGGPAPIAPMAPRTPLAPIAAISSWSHQSHSYGGGFSYAYGYDDEQRFVIVSGATDALTMSGSSEDARHVEKLKKQIAGDFIWFQRDEKSYVIRDQAIVDRARKLWAPQEELGKRQQALGKQQEELGKQQEALGKRMEEARVSVPDMTATLDKLRAELKQLSSGATQDQIGKIQSEVGELQSKIGEVQSRAGDQQSKLGEEMGALGEKQGKLGEEQGELGRQQGELAQRAVREMKELLDEAIKKGTAQPEPEMGGGASL
jgi:beta-lactamase regulating signal transducer with metallopeptidase domain